MTEQNMKKQGFDRRTVNKAAAWSVPVIAAAVSAPMAAASVVTQFDVAISSECVGGITIPLTSINAFGDPTFEIAAATGTIPVGTTFTLSSAAVLSAGVIDTGGNLLDVSLLGDGSLLITTQAEIVAGSPVTIAVPISDGAINTDLLGDYSLTFTSAPSGFEESGPGANSASVSNTQVTAAGAQVSVCAA
ncbi:hypothetical protein [Zhihengliuella salsuginis]|uniref:Uncharacterized protein n=1 Tax=Zhihengliuella salsuginis TaxID=578222 RepID=A0ABQ3GM14_9MICC|nr:hypothetical protein [Zhihengliuella salsuginis]GHD09786.1 hypothetical protein GCM10008096_22800 [Zhihengliuella salsuginis]